MSQPTDIDARAVLARLEQNALAWALQGDGNACYAATMGLALGRQLLAAIAQRDHVIAALQEQLKPEAAT